VSGESFPRHLTPDELRVIADELRALGYTVTEPAIVSEPRSLGTGHEWRAVGAGMRGVLHTAGRATWFGPESFPVVCTRCLLRSDDPAAFDPCDALVERTGGAPSGRGDGVSTATAAASKTPRVPDHHPTNAQTGEHPA
jgi:hypothetical protein